MEKVIILQKSVTDYLETLIFVLFEKEYFGFEETAQLYVSKIYNFIEKDLVKFPSKKTPPKLQKFGSNYAFYKANKTTTWYIFFETKNSRYLITHITNNHMAEASFL